VLDYFSSRWMQAYRDAWNAEPELAGSLADAGFNAVIGYGVLNEPHPRGVLQVEDGKVVRAGPYRGEALAWDLRASDETWRTWLETPPGLMQIGSAYTNGRLQILAGDYVSMIKDSRMARPFVKSFETMARISAH
jgi:hypothetical protein